MAAGASVWIEAARPKTLPAAVIPVLVGTAFAWAHDSAHFGKAAVCLAFALLVQIGTNFANDYFDFVQGADTPERVGPRRAVAAGLVSPRQMLAATAVVLTVAFAVGMLLVIEGGWVLLPIGIVSIVCALAYTGGPYPLGYNGLGDVFVFIFFGLVAVGATYFVQASSLPLPILWVGAAIGLLAANILVVNNYRDAETDARAGKRTLVVRLGKRFARWQYGTSMAVALIVPVLQWQWSGLEWPLMLPLALAPWAFRLSRRLARASRPAEQIELLGSTAKFLAAYGVLLSAGAVIARWLSGVD